MDSRKPWLDARAYNRSAPSADDGVQHRFEAQYLQVAIVTLYDASPEYDCAVPLWCQSAFQLSRQIPNSSVVMIGKNRSVDCPDALLAWSPKMQQVSNAAKSWTKRFGKAGSWDYLRHSVLHKWAVFALIR